MTATDIQTAPLTTQAFPRWKTQHEFDHEPTYVVNPHDDAQDVEMAACIPHESRIRVGRTIAALMANPSITLDVLKTRIAAMKNAQSSWKVEHALNGKGATY